ncbi:MAG TPA: hypothetical protein VGE26_07830 [Sphingobacteriaceae bacterium]
MKKNIFIAIIALSVSACGINRQVDNLKAFEKCKYEVTAADSVYVGNMDVSQIVNKNGFDLVKMPGIVFAMLRKDVPLKARLKLKIQNPTNAEAAINQFEYKVLHKSIELASGYVNEKVRVEPNGGVTTVPIDIHSNIYHVLADPKAQQAFVDFISDDGSPGKKAVLTIKIKPTLDIGNKQIKYPGYITIDKEITNKILF